ncbi:apolipoprotein L3-like [Bufo gargarizans]|uniref:apolipoprotein L3-like n=1 Tax=Bufo gargarizans TaxID=30331 RepID=UPI001CF34259|nr:apolipoprotein L3-like [Bufo gargarizans]
MDVGQFKKVKEYLPDFIDTVGLLIGIIGSCITEMTTIADELDKFHRGATIASVTGSSFGIAGGITTIVGLALAPFTLGASLIVSGVGIGVAVAGGVTGASASIADIINTKNKCNRVQEIVDQIDEKMKELKELSDNINLVIVNLQSCLDAEEIFNLTRLLVRGTMSSVEISRLAQLGKITTMTSRGAQLAARGIQAAGVISGVLAALFIILDATFVVKGAMDLHKGSKTEEAARIRACVKDLQTIYQELQEIYNLFEELSDFVKY